MTTKVCFLGGARYGRPLDATSEKKFRGMNELGGMFTIGFCLIPRLSMFTKYVGFCLASIPKQRLNMENTMLVRV
jgi:hypothetical protein